jgi:hypothetical protein
MTVYASNCPVSRPVKLHVTVDADLNGLQWSNRHGLVYEPTEEFEPIRPPADRPRGA